MKKIALLASTFVFSYAIMAQTDTKPATPTTTHSLSTKTKAATTTPTKTDVAAPVKPAADATQATQPSPDDVIKVNVAKHDFGNIPQGKPVTYAFEIKNTSSKPVVVENTYASCGCTTPDRIVEPIAPGATVPLKVQYNAAAVGPFTKQVHIKLAGITQEKIVEISGTVAAPDAPKENKPNN